MGSMIHDDCLRIPVFFFALSLSHPFALSHLSTFNFIVVEASARSIVLTYFVSFVSLTRARCEHNVNAFCEIIHHVSMPRMPHAPRRCKCTACAQRASVSPDEYQVTRVHQRANEDKTRKHKNEKTIPVCFFILFRALLRTIRFVAASRNERQGSKRTLNAINAVNRGK